MANKKIEELLLKSNVTLPELSFLDVLSNSVYYQSLVIDVNRQIFLIEIFIKCLKLEIKKQSDE